MKKLLMSLVLLLLVTAPSISYSKHRLLPLANDIEKQTQTLKTILNDVENVHGEILSFVSQNEAFYNRMFVDSVHKVYIVYYFTSNGLHLINKGIIRDGMIDECKDTMCKDMVFLHYYQAGGIKISAQIQLEVLVKQLRLLTVKIKNTRLSYQLNKVIINA